MASLTEREATRGGGIRGGWGVSGRRALLPVTGYAGRGNGHLWGYQENKPREPCPSLSSRNAKHQEHYSNLMRLIRHPEAGGWEA